MRDHRRVAVIILLGLILGMSAGCGSRSISTPFSREPGSLETTLVAVYYPAVNDQVLIREGKRVPLDGDVKLAALDELFKGEKIEPVIPLGSLTDEVEVHGVAVDASGIAVVDFSPDILRLDAPEEYLRLLIAAIVQTLTQFEDVEAVTFSVDGRVEGEADGRRIEDWWGSVTLAEGPWR